MLTLYRRHLKSCTADRARGTAAAEKDKCRCPIWVQGTWQSESVRKSLDVNRWAKAEKLKRNIEDGITEEKPKEGITLEAALKAFLDDNENRTLCLKARRRYRLLGSRLLAFAADHGLTRCLDFTTNHLRDFRGTWHLGPRTAEQEVNRLRVFFRFCIDSGWLTQNPAKNIKPSPEAKRVIPRLPFNENEIQKIIAQTKTDQELGFVLCLRHTGLRIGDVSLLKMSQVSNDRVSLYTSKSGSVVSIKIPETLSSLLQRLQTKGGYFFLRGESTNVDNLTELWRGQFQKWCKAAGVAKPWQPHRLRHSLACSLLSQGVSVENVAAILGNSPAIVVKHYAQWVKNRQEALDRALESTWQSKLKLVKGS